MNSMYQYKSQLLGAVIKDIDGKKGIISGYFSHFDNVDGDGDIIRKGAFTKTIKENGPGSAMPRIKHLLNHEPGQPLGVLLDLKEDEIGLAYNSQIGQHSLGLDFVKMVESGLITETDKSVAPPIMSLPSFPWHEAQACSKSCFVSVEVAITTVFIRFFFAISPKP